MLNLPSTVLVNRVMPKKAFYEHLKTTTAIKEQFVQQIERVEMAASIKEISIHIPGDRDVAEIDVLALYLKGAAVPYEAIELVARSIPNMLLFVCLTDDSCKLLVRRDRLYETEWMHADDTKLELVGSTLGELWDSIVSQVVFGDPVAQQLLHGHAHGRHRFEIDEVVAEVGHLRGLNSAFFLQQAQGGHFGLMAGEIMTHAQPRHAGAYSGIVPARDDGNIQSCPEGKLYAYAVMRVKALQRVSASVHIQLAVGTHAVHVKHEHAHVGSLSRMRNL